MMYHEGVVPCQDASDEMWLTTTSFNVVKSEKRVAEVICFQTLEHRDEEILTLRISPPRGTPR
jgi:hypothetical protein